MARPDDGDTGNKGGDTAELEDLARRFQDLWRDQMAAMSADRDIAGMMSQWMAAFGGAASPSPAPGAFNPGDPAAWMAAFGAAMPGASTKDTDHDTTEHPPAGPAGAAPAAAASGAGDVAGDQLERRLADLERRLERLEAGVGGAGGGAAKRTRRR
jgi:hypothetical protein